MKSHYDFVKGLYLHLKKRKELPPLKPLGAWNPEISIMLNKENDIPKPVVSALALCNDDLRLSHEVSQSINTPIGSWLHGCMHRREGDFSNSKYWYRKVGSHACFFKISSKFDGFLAQYSPKGEVKLKSLGKVWNPFDFIDLCSEAEFESRHIHKILKQAQLIELELLVEITMEEHLK